MSDSHAILIGILSGIPSGIIAYYAARGIDLYLSRRPTRSRQRQIKQLTQELQLLEKVGVTDRALLLYAFTMLFALIAVAALGMAGWVVLSLIPRSPDNPTWAISLLLPLVIALIAFSAASVFRKLEDPEPTLAKLRQKLLELRGVDDRSPPG